MGATVVERLAPRLREMAARLADLDRQLADPIVTGDAALVKRLLRERGDVDRPVQLFRAWEAATSGADESRAAAAREGDQEMAALYVAEAAEKDAVAAGLAQQIVDMVLEDDGDAARNAILEIRAGTGGDEAALFVGDLVRLYTRYAERQGWEVDLVAASVTPLGGFRDAILGISGRGAFGRLRYESGGHRVQRIPTTETQGRIHTSAATVAVLPEVSEVDIEIRPGDLRIDTYRSSGAGGQNVNKTSSAIRVTHLPSGLVVTCQDERSQHKNKARALSVLRARLYEAAREERDRARASDRRAQVGSGDRSERIRTYNFPQSRVTDHRANVSIHDLPRVLDGGIDELIQPLVDRAREERLRALLDSPT